MKDAALLLGISARQFKGFAAERKEGAAHAIQNAFHSVTVSDCSGWFRSCVPSDLLSALNPKILPRVKHTHNIILHHLVWLGNVFFVCGGKKHEQLYANNCTQAR